MTSVAVARRRGRGLHRLEVPVPVLLRAALRARGHRPGDRPDPVALTGSWIDDLDVAPTDVGCSTSRPGRCPGSAGRPGPGGHLAERFGSPLPAVGPQAVGAARWSPDGTRIAFADIGSGELRVWHLGTGREQVRPRAGRSAGRLLGVRHRRPPVVRRPTRGGADHADRGRPHRNQGPAGPGVSPGAVRVDDRGGVAVGGDERGRTGSPSSPGSPGARRRVTGPGGAQLRRRPDRAGPRTAWTSPTARRPGPDPATGLSRTGRRPPARRACRRRRSRTGGSSFARSSSRSSTRSGTRGCAAPRRFGGASSRRPSCDS